MQKPVIHPLTPRTLLKRLLLILFLIPLLLVIIGAALHGLRPTTEKRFGPVIHEVESDFSVIRIREKGSLRTMLFVDQDGVEQTQSSINIEAPAEHQLGYTQSLFASLLFTYPQHRVLIVGLGGGGMVQFLNFTFPAMRVEAVEIDPVVVDLAAEYFFTRPGPQIRIHTQDAFEFFDEEHGQYDAIYMDAFLQPPANSGLEEKTLRLKTVEFLNQLQTHLSPDGVVAFNIIPAEDSAEANLAAIDEAFASTYAFDVPGTGNRVVIASKSKTEASKASLIPKARQLDEALLLDFSFEDIANSLRTQ